MEQVIPGFCVFQSNYGKKYLRYVDEGKQHRYIKCDEEKIYHPLSKFRVERAKSDTNLVHIKSCYNNKYWQRSGEKEDYIVATGDAKNEDKTKWSCTLFKPIFKSDKTFRFQHVQNGNYLQNGQLGDAYQGYLIVRFSKENPDGCDLFRIYDWESLVLLPKYVAFKGNNGKYLRYVEGNDRMDFDATDIGDSKVGDEIFTNPDGSVCVKHNSNGKFWKASPNWILPTETNASNSDPTTTFWPIKLDGNAVALKCVDNDRFLCRTSYGGKDDCLAAASWATTIDKYSHLAFEELVISRRIYDVEYRLQDAIVYDKTPLTLARSCVTNMTQQTETLEVTMSYTQSWKHEWSSTTSKSSTFSIGFSAGVPMIAETSIKVNKSKAVEYQWGSSVEGALSLTKTVPVTVPPMTKTTVELLATFGECDVPFSYTQHDTLTNGELDVSVRNDGLYRGANSFSIHTETSEKKIPT